MGVFSWFRRKPAATVEASVPEAAVGAPAEEAGETEKSEVIDGTAGTPAAAEPAEEVAPAVEATGSTDAAAETVVPPVDGGTAAEAVEIPRQQSAEEAADSEAGEGARK
ncbi:hypothetical protein H3L99_26445 [Streptomyces pristinaespiralis]|jgi:hypothetical protein|uniref:Uncharacterized protein n=1 Tax=Streptomyces pristinaespiralis TaxID=38300 RepID=A0A0M4DDJ3_STRPR|nr:hypothetical protein SPRI_2116 [Streptomyces pristinaespiralis]QMU16718.1 hypothetical protein H3L99_26445 [Streptomyces pristinaespiralis]